MNEIDIINKNFSRYAKYYDRHSKVQNKTASKLINCIGAKEFGNILDIGCGTGNYTSLLRDRFPAGNIKALDISDQMVSAAGQKLKKANIEFIVADAEKVTFEEKFDLITSNACFQWFSNLERVLTNYGKVINKNGIILFSTFGPLTFQELGESLQRLYGKEISLSSAAFIEKGAIEKILKKYFDNVVVEQEIVKETYDSLWELLNTIKYTGAGGFGINNGHISKGMMNAMEEIYKERFNSIAATYQIFYCYAEQRN